MCGRVTDIKVTSTHPNYAPWYDTRFGAYDLIAALPDGPIQINPGKTRAVKCGFSLDMPDSYRALVLTRGDISFKHGMTVLNAPGLIPASYKGQVMVMLKNTSDEPYVVAANDRIAHMVFEAVTKVNLV